jgi:hypothetical protein
VVFALFESRAWRCTRCSDGHTWQGIRSHRRRRSHRPVPRPARQVGGARDVVAVEPNLFVVRRQNGWVPPHSRRPMTSWPIATRAVQTEEGSTSPLMARPWTCSTATRARCFSCQESISGDRCTRTAGRTYRKEPSNETPPPASTLSPTGRRRRWPRGTGCRENVCFFDAGEGDQLHVHIGLRQGYLDPAWGHLRNLQWVGAGTTP